MCAASSSKTSSTVQLVQHWDDLLMRNNGQNLLDELLHQISPQQADTPVKVAESKAEGDASIVGAPLMKTKRQMEQLYEAYWEDAQRDDQHCQSQSPVALVVDGLARFEGVCNNVVESTRYCAALVDDLQRQYSSTVQKMASLQKDCERLVKERDQLVKMSEGLGSRLTHFVHDRESEDEMYEMLLEGEINLEEMDVISHMMQKLDDSIAFLSNHPNFKESRAYLNKYRLLQTRALSNMRDFVVEKMKLASEVSQQRVREQQQRRQAPSPQDQHKQAESTRSTSLQNATDDIANATTLSHTSTEPQQQKSDHNRLPSATSTTSSSIQTDPFQDSFYRDEDEDEQIIVTPLHWLSSLYIEFRAELEPLRPILHEIEKRASLQEYSPLLLDCFNCYVNQRQQMQMKTVKSTIQKLVTRGDLATLVRSGCSFVIQLSLQEQQLFHHLFTSESMLTGFRAMMDRIYQTMHDGLHTLLLSYQRNQQEADLNNLDTLCKLIEILRGEILMEEVSRRGALVVWFEPTLHRMIQDVQERVIFLASNFINKRIRSFKPTPEDLDYPEKLKKLFTVTTDNADVTLDTSLRQWYPTMGISLLLLDKLSRSVESTVFEALSLETIALCTRSFIDASKKISEKQGVMDGELFLVKHLLGLQKQLLPFRLGTSRSPSHVSQYSQSVQSTSSAYDFSSLREGISRFLRGQASFRMQDIIYEIMSPSKPKFTHSAGDTRRDIEAQLKRACESLILNVTRVALDPIMTFLKRNATDQKLKNEQSAQTSLASSPSTAVSAETCIGLFKKVQSSAYDTMIMAHEKLSLYLNNPTVRSDLLQSIQSSMVEVYEQFVSFVNSHFIDDQQQLQKVTAEIYSVPEFISRLQSFQTKETKNLPSQVPPTEGGRKEHTSVDKQ